MGGMLREHCSRVGLWSFAALVLAFLVLPLAVVIPESFSSGLYLQFPPPGWSLQWYRGYFGSPEWIDATLLSLEVAGCVAVLATVVGCLAATALVRMAFRGKAIVRVLLMTPMIVPTIVVAISAYSLYSDLHLVATFSGIVLAHTVLALPFAVMLLTSGLEQVDVRLEEASGTMGAPRLHTFRYITLPLLWPSLAAAALFAFVTSWDEIIMVIFIGGGGETTLPLKMFSYLRTEINPVIAAVSTLLLALVGVAFALGAVASRRSAWRRASRAPRGAAAEPDPSTS